PTTSLATEKPPVRPSCAVFVRVTSTFSPSATVTLSGLKTGAPHTTPGTSGRFVSVKVTTVPTGRFCGPSTTVPSARTVSVPVTGVPSRSYAYSTVNAVSAGTSDAPSPVSAFATENPPAGAVVASLVTTTSAVSLVDVRVIEAGSNVGVPHTTPSTSGSVVSANVTTVPGGRRTRASTAPPPAATTPSPVVGPAHDVPSGSCAVHVTANSVPSGTSPAASPATCFSTEKVPKSSVAVFVTVTVTTWPSATVTVSGSNAGAPHTTPSNSGISGSANVTTVPTGRSSGPTATVPSVSSANVPLVSPP